MKELSGKHGMKQSEIARKLGITQASVSQYLSATRAADGSMIERFPKILTYAEDISERIVEGESRRQWYGVLCRACKDIREDDEFCKMHRMATKISGCDICKKK